MFEHLFHHKYTFYDQAYSKILNCFYAKCMPLSMHVSACNSVILLQLILVDFLTED